MWLGPSAGDGEKGGGVGGGWGVSSAGREPTKDGRARQHLDKLCCASVIGVEGARVALPRSCVTDAVSC